MNVLRCSVVFAAVAGICSGQAPDFYKKISRVTWVIKSLDRPLQGWSRLGLSDVQEFGDLAFTGEYRGKAMAGGARVATGHLGGVNVDFVQPAPGASAFADFLARRGDGVFSIVHEVGNAVELTKETARLQGLGVEVLQRLSVDTDSGPATFTYFDTEARGKYVLGLVYWPGGAPPAGTPGQVSHIAFVARELAPVSAYWEKLGFPPVSAAHAGPREDSRYHGKPLWLSFDVGWDGHTQPGAEWIVPPQAPPNCYNDFLQAHGEGVHHLGVPVDDLEKAVAEYGKLGYSVLQSGAWGESGKKNSGRYAYMDTDAIGGVIVELIRAIK